MSSPARLAWRKFRSNIPAMLGLGYVGLCVGVAIFANLISPDPTEHANQQFLSLAKKPPGTRAWVLYLPIASQSSEVLGKRTFWGGTPQHSNLSY